MKKIIRKLGKYRFNVKIIEANRKEIQFQHDTMEATDEVISELFGASVLSFLPISSWDNIISDIVVLQNPKNIYWNKRN